MTEYGPEYAEGVDHTIKTTADGRCYIELKGHTKPVGAIAMGLDYNDTSTYLDNCALRLDGSTEYEEYGEIKTTFDPSIVAVIETTTGQRIQADKNGNVTGFTFSGNGADMQFYLSGLSGYFTLIINYRESLAQRVQKITNALLSYGILK